MEDGSSEPTKSDRVWGNVGFLTRCTGKKCKTVFTGEENPVRYRIWAPKNVWRVISALLSVAKHAVMGLNAVISTEDLRHVIEKNTLCERRKRREICIIASIIPVIANYSNNNDFFNICYSSADCPMNTISTYWSFLAC